MFETVTIETDARGVAVLTLNRPEKHNAMSAQMLADLTDAAGKLASDDAVRVVVLTGAGKSFCAGGDLGWMRDQADMDSETRSAEAGKLATMLGALNALPKPVIGKLQGNAFGGGVGVISVCDAAVAVPDARFGLTEVRLGLIPANIGPYVVARMGAFAARQVFMNGAAFSADRAVELNLLSGVCAPDALDAAIEDLVAPYLACAPGAVREAKALLNALVGPVQGAEVDLAIDALAKRWETEEARAGIAAFFDKRPAPWAEGG